MRSLRPDVLFPEVHVLLSPKAHDNLPSALALGIHWKLLCGRRRYYLQELMAQFGCSHQAVLRAVQAIRTLHGAQLRDGLEGRRRWFQLAGDGPRRTVELSEEEIRHLLLCRDLAWNLLPAAFRTGAEGSLLKASALLPLGAQGEEAFAPVAEAVPRGQVDYSGFEEILFSLSRAVAGRRLCRIRYATPWQEAARDHLVAPFALVAHADALYLRCRPCWPDGEQRPDRATILLAVHRMEGVEVIDRRYRGARKSEPAPGFGLMLREPSRIEVRFTGWARAHVAERVWSPDQEIFEEEDATVLRFTARSHPEAVTWILGFGPCAEVLSPAEVREEVRERLAEALAHYAAGMDGPAAETISSHRPESGGFAAHRVGSKEETPDTGGATMVKTVISGGQTGADRAGLDVAEGFGLHRGGWCPKGRRAEDGPIPASYPLKATPSEDYQERTRWNVRDSDGTLVLVCAKVGRGSKLTVETAKTLRKPHLLVDLAKDPDPAAVRRWIARHEIAVLNVAGSRETKSRPIYERARSFLRDVLGPSASRNEGHRGCV